MTTAFGTYIIYMLMTSAQIHQGIAGTNYSTLSQCREATAKIPATEDASCYRVTVTLTTKNDKE